VVAAPADAAVAVVAPPVDAAAPAVGHLIVRYGVWCNLWIDGVPFGDRRNKSIEVTAGRHSVRCLGNPMGEWTRETDVPAGGTRTLDGPPLDDVKVTLDVDATIDGKPYVRGAVVKLKPGNVEVIAGDKKQFITFRVSCTLRDTPALGCYL
jgi:hypothetical protein